MDKLKSLYDEHPYPGTGPMPPARELVNLLQLHRLENKFGMEGLRILDAGVGSGNRLIELVRTFPDNDYVALDYSESSLAHAQQRFAEAGFAQVTFKQANLETSLDDFGRFDLIVCMGVLHHLSNPQLAMQHLSALCHAESTLFFYVYGEPGSAERMRRKRILNLLASDAEGLDWFEWVRRCEFIDLPYGWGGLGDGLPLYLDAYRNPRETLYDCDKIAALLANARSPLSFYAAHGWISDGVGRLVDLDSRRSKLPVKTTVIEQLSNDDEVKARFFQLPQRERLLLLEQVYSPEAYTYIVWGEHALNALDPTSRLRRSALRLEELS